MSRRTSRSMAWVVALACLALEGAAQAATYQIEPIFRAGDPIGAVRTRAKSSLLVGSLNDRGQLLFVAENAAGGQLLIQRTEGRLASIVAAGEPAPVGVWSKTVRIPTPGSMNQRGNAVFNAEVTVNGETNLGTFLWDEASRRVSSIALKGMPAVASQTFVTAGGWAPVINNRDEIALVASVESSGGREREGVFLRDATGRLLPIAVPLGLLPDGRRIFAGHMPSLNDAGLVGLLARPERDSLERPCLWEQGTLTPLLWIDQKALGGQHLGAFTGLWVNNRNSNLLFSILTHALGGACSALYLVVDGTIRSVLLPGQEMPDGGWFLTVQPQDPASVEISLGTGVSAANDAGQRVFLATLEDGTTAAYLMEPDGQLSLVLKSGTVTSLGKIAAVGQGKKNKAQGLGFNNRGQIALPVQIADGANMIVLLTPSSTQ